MAKVELSAPSKKSLVSVSSPILAWRVLTSTGGAPRSVFSDPNTPAARSRSSAFQAVIWLGWTSNCCASSASVFSPLTAAKATFALKAGVWFRRGRLLIISPALQPSWPPSGRSLYGAYWCQARNGKAGSFPTTHPRLLQPGFGSVHNDPRGTRHRAQTIAPHPCIRRIQRIQTMMQSYASAAKLRSGGSILHCGLRAMLPLGAPPPRIVIWAPYRGGTRPECYQGNLLRVGSLACRTQDNAVRSLAGGHHAPQRNEQLSRQRHDQGLARAAPGIGRARPIPLGQCTLLLVQQKAPG